MEMTFKIENGMLVTEATPEIEAAGIKEGAKFVVVKTATGFALQDERAARQMEAAEEIMQRRHAVLEELAK